jgi:2-haloacid dehalogenase
MPYDVYLIDADDTMFDFDKAETTALTGMFQRYALRCSEGVRIRYRDINNELWAMFERGELSKEIVLIERFVRLSKVLGIPLDAEEFNRLYLLELGKCSDLLEGAEALCKRLFEEGKHIYIATNGTPSATQKSRLAASPLPPYVSGVFVSEDVGWQKPQKEYFDYIFAHIPPVDKSRVLMVGDSLSSDMRGGQNAGLDTCWFNPDHKPNPSDVRPTYEVAALAEIAEL